MFVIVVVVFRVAVTVVKVLHVVPMLHRLMGTIASAVRVLGKGMLCFHSFSHDGLLWAGSSVARLP